MVQPAPRSDPSRLPPPGDEAMWAAWQGMRMALLSARKVGFLLTALGAAHFATPEAFEEVTRTAFPENTKEWVVRNGAAEAAIGVAMMLKPTRKLGLAGLLGYTGWLGYNAVKAQG